MAIQRLSTREALVESLIELSALKPFDKITVEEIARNCGVAKRTFYNHFVDKYDLAVYVYVHKLRNALDTAAESRSYYEFELNSIIEYARYSDYYQNTVKNSSGIDSIHERMVRATEDLFRKLIALRPNPVAMDEELEFQITYDAYGLISSIFRWDFDGRKVSAERLARWCTDSIHPELGRAMGFAEWWDGSSE